MIYVSLRHLPGGRREGFAAQAPVDKLLADIASLVVAHHGGIQEAREEEKAEDKEHDEQLHENDEPQSTPPRHASEALQIKSSYVHRSLLHVFEIIISTNIGTFI